MSGETGTRDRVEHPLGRRFELYAQMRLAAWASGRTVPAVTREALQAKLQAMRRPHQAWLNRFADGGEVCLGFLRDRLGPPRRAWALAGLVGVAAVTVLWWRSEATGHPLTARASTPPAADDRALVAVRGDRSSADGEGLNPARRGRAVIAPPVQCGFGRGNPAFSNANDHGEPASAGS